MHSRSPCFVGLKGLIPDSDLESGFQRGMFRIVVPMVVGVGLHAECRGGFETSYGISRPCETYGLTCKFDSKQVANRDPPPPPTRRNGRKFKGCKRGTQTLPDAVAAIALFFHPGSNGQDSPPKTPHAHQRSPRCTFTPF